MLRDDLTRNNSTRRRNGRWFTSSHHAAADRLDASHVRNWRLRDFPRLHGHYVTGYRTRIHKRVVRDRSYSGRLVNICNAIYRRVVDISLVVSVVNVRHLRYIHNRVSNVDLIHISSAHVI